MTCERCGHAEPPAQVNLLSVRVNETAVVYRVRLCEDCKVGALSALRRAVEPVGRAAA